MFSRVASFPPLAMARHLRIQSEMKGAQPIKTKTTDGGGPSRGGKDSDSDDSMRDTHADSNYMQTEAERMLKRANKDDELFGKL